MYGSLKNQLKKELSVLESSGLFKKERVILTSQGASVFVEGNKEVIIMCANNYLGLSSNSEVVNAAKLALETHGLLKGIMISFKRVITCHPIKILGGGEGFDPVKKKIKIKK